MTDDNEEEERIRSAALQNARSIFLARQRAERELIEVKEALERKTEELAQQREWLRVTLASIGDAVITTDTENRVTFLNPVAEALSGWGSADACGQALEHVFNIVNEDTRKPVQPLRDCAFADPSSRTVLIRKSGEEVPIETSVAPIRDASRRTVGAAIVFHDVTERRRSERALRESEARLNMAMEAAQMGAWEWIVASGKVTWSPLLEAIHGLPPGTFGGRFEDFHRDMHPQDREGILKILEGSVERRIDYRVEYRIVMPDGSLRWIEARGRPFMDIQGNLQRMVGIAQDITERKQIEQALRESEERFRQIAENTTDILWLWAPDGDTTLYANQAFETTWGRSVQEVQENPLTWADAIHPEDRERVAAEFEASAMSGGYNEEYRVVRPDGSIRWVLDRAFPVRDERGDVYRVAGIVQDITERKILERELIEASNREQRRLGRDLHDDLGQWLTGIHLEARALLMKLKPISASAAAQAEKLVSYAREALERTRMLARGMTPAVIESGGLAASLRDLADTTERMFHTRCTCSCSEAVNVRDPEAALHLFRIAQESISNAIRHGQATEVLLSLGFEEEGHAFLLARDNGKGIPMSPLKTLGLGLRTMQYRAGLMGASVEIRPAVGGGTEVICKFSRDL